MKTVADLAAFDALLDSYRALSDSERLKGNYLEQLTRQYLLNDAQMKRQFCEVWLWKDWPDRAGRPDCGIDLVAQGRDGSLAAVQCKLGTRAAPAFSLFAGKAKHPTVPPARAIRSGAANS